MVNSIGSVLVPAGTELFHSSTAVDDLVTSGFFDSSQSFYGGAMFLSSDVTKHTNIVATVAEDLRLLNMAGLDEDLSYILTDLNKAGLSLDADEAVRLGFHGLRATTSDYFTERHDGTQCDELVILGSSLHRLTNIRRFSNLSLS